MKIYRIPMVPGPVSVSREVLEAGQENFGSADLEKEYIELYKATEKSLRKIMQTKNSVVIQTGEGMLALWSALKSCLLPGDKVLVLSTGLFGYGMGGMAEAIGCEVRTVGFGFDETFTDFDLIEKAIREFQPKMITMVQNETPSGTMNPVAEIGALKEKYAVPLLYVDAVSGLGGSVVKTDEWHIDLCLGASQKCLSAPASMSFLSVSDRAWEIIEEVGYVGYDALLPFRTAVKNAYFPYTPYWQGTAQLNKACELILEEGLGKVIARHQKVAGYCRERIVKMGLKLSGNGCCTFSYSDGSLRSAENILEESGYTFAGRRPGGRRKLRMSGRRSFPYRTYGDSGQPQSGERSDGYSRRGNPGKLSV